MSVTKFDPAAAGWEPYYGSEFIDLVGPIWKKRENGKILLGLLAADQHGNRNGMVHGGMLMTMLDHAIALNSWEANGHKPQVTIQLDVQFVSKVAKGDFLVVRSEIMRRSRTMNFMRGIGTVGERVAITASGLWKVFDEETPSAWPAG